ncbi:MucR family transcriptional regulator [Novosphingobium sp. PY1]|uniref:Predicted transcriptional regulator n=1 Tax=Ochrobactrum sp. PW1 TaxID=1882222 RepID=A0A292GSZ4_9HYPH|nr:MucR family transcriptional regulator [Novosphingobium sp. PY1]BBA74301.1 predicted transcriptional regulator [Ochrobactrum sp. PW1]GFM29150.1 predicted transcriptional regulator [Novosphingobium sp. PY1]
MSADLLEMSVNLVTAHLSRNEMSAVEVPEFLKKVHDTLKEMRGEGHSGAVNSSTGIATGQAMSAPPAPPAISSPESEAGNSNKVAVKLGNDLSDPAFTGLDPWLCERISPGIAARLNRDESVHPSIFPDKIICLEDGKAVKLLRPYIKKMFDLTVEEYTSKWMLPDSFPMTPPAYRENKRRLAQAAGLGKAVRANKEKRGRSKIVSEKMPRHTNS